MKVLIDIGHPAHVHLFRPFANKMIEKGHSILFTCREKEFEIELLKTYKFGFYSFGKKYTSIFGKIFGLFKFDLLITIKGLVFKPDIFLSHGSPYAAHAAALLRRTHIALEDTGNNEQVKLYLPFTKHVLTSKAFHKNYGSKQIRYHGYHELAYLHPNNFIPNKDILHELNIKVNTPFFLIRFVSWNASHDIGENGFSLQEKIKLIDFLKSKGKIFISSEKELPLELKKFSLKLHPSKIHHLMAYAKLFISEGATMASESAVLGTPAIYINSMEAGTISEQEKYGLVYHFKNGNDAIAKVSELLEDTDLKNKAKLAQKKMLNNNIDVSSFLVWFIENYPNSVKIIHENPNYDFNFK